MNFSETLKQLRTNKGLTQRDLASLLSLSHGSIAMYETGKREPDISTIKKIATFFDVSIDFLLGSKTPDKPVDTLSERIAELPEDKRKTIETLLKVYEMENNNENAATSSGK
jgi:transcriptional regulator with XRE-family HTH domain